MLTTVVYFARCGDGLLKIGYTRFVRARLRTLEVEHKMKFRLLGLIRGHLSRENAIHRQWAHLRAVKNGPGSREIYRRTPELDRWVRKLLRDEGVSISVAPSPVNLTIRVDKDQFRRLKRAADADGRTVVGWVRTQVLKIAGE